MTWIAVSYAPPDDYERLEIWHSLTDDLKKKHSVDDMFFPKYNAQEIWENWSKIQSTYVGSKYRFIPDFNQNVYFINIDLFLSTVAEHQDIFNAILEKPVTGEELLACICDESSPLWQRFKSSHALNGILLGFGIQNAISFERRMKGEECHDSQRILQRRNIALHLDRPKLHHLGLPEFRIFAGGEESIERYESERSSIIDNLKGKDLYKITAEMLKAPSLCVESEK